MNIFRRHLCKTLCFFLLLSNGLVSFAQNTSILWPYNMNDGSTIHSMSDNGKWAVAYGVNDATSTYSYPKLVDLTRHSFSDILTQDELDAGIESYANDVTDDGNIVVGCYEGKPAYWTASTKKWTILPVAAGNAGGHVEAITPDGKYAVGICTKGGFDEVPMMWDIASNSIITLAGLPNSDLSGYYQDMTRLTGISADGRYIVGCVSYSYPADILYFLYDRQTATFDALAFDYNKATNRYTTRDESVLTLDGICISPNGKWVGGIVYSTQDVRHPFRYNVETKTFENFNRPEDLDKGCVVVDNEGTIYAATPAVNPTRSLYVLHSKYWYGLDEILKQNFNVDFYNKTGFSTTGLAIGLSADCKTMTGIAYISQENYQITLPYTFAEACAKVNLLDSYNVSVRNGATVQKLSNITLKFNRSIEVLAKNTDIVLRDEAGNAVRSALKFSVDASSDKNVLIGFRTTILEAGKKYTIEIPEGAICIKGDANHKNKGIVLQYTGWGEKAIEMVSVSPTKGSSLGHLDMNTNPVIFSFTNDVIVAADGKAWLYKNDESEPVAELLMLQGNTSSNYNQILVYPPSTTYLYKGNTYKVVIPQGALTDVAGYATNAEASVTYEGTYERTVVSDNSHIFIETFESGVTGMLLYDGDGNTPGAEMSAWNFSNRIPWIHAADDDYSNPCAVSHSMYSPTGKSNDWMMTPALRIPDSKCTLNFQAQSYRKAKNDVLKVWIYASEEAINELDAETVEKIQQEGDLVVNERLSPGNAENTLGGDWQEFNVSLEKYAGKQIHIAFVNQNEDQSAIFVGNVNVAHNADVQISLVGVPETTVAQTSQHVKGAIKMLNENKTYQSLCIELLDAKGATLEKIEETGLSLSKDDVKEFVFQTALPLTKGEICQFAVRVNLNNGESTDQLSASIKNLAFVPKKRVVLEENTGMGCQNCPLGHQATEHLAQVYKDAFIPVAYHTYTGDKLESGMTDYAQYFLGLNAAPTAMVHRNGRISSPMVAYTEGGATDYTFSSKEGDTWLDEVNKEMGVYAEADFNITASHNAETGAVEVPFTANFAVAYPSANIGLLCIVTEDGLVGYQTNAFYTVTDTDLGEWAAGGAYGKSHIYPFTFDHVARALYPANAYNGQTGLLPNSIECEKAYTGKVRFNLAQHAPYVEDINNCHIVCLMIDANTGRVINAASAKVQNGTSAIESTTDANGRIQVKSTKGGILVDAKEDVRVTLFDAAGRMLHQANGKGRLWLPTSHQGVIVVKCETADAVSTQKVVL